ncbi:hypothetical protein FRB96_000793 [Tulasnella sp. 330]|nr:hypothetical protein FRB96_000793 [Tulasnella sp. 330]KAG8882518.1 hypothetical protein FRB97_008144 [Tulasnella sp. 331]
MDPPTTARAPTFFCYECNAEMRPLMMPDPHCASCHGTFVEEIPSTDATTSSDTQELASDDPRNFQLEDANLHGPFGPGLGGGGPGANDPVIQLMNALMGSMAGMPASRGFGTPPGPPGTGGNQATIRFDMGGSGRGRVFIASGGGGGGPPMNILGGGLLGSTGVPRSTSPSAGGAATGAGGGVGGGAGGGTQPLPHPLESLLSVIMGRPIGAPASGPWGDYVFDQHGLDEIITNLMEQSQGARPVPAPEDMIANLPRTKVFPKSPLTEKECAVCKDAFTPTTEDGEQVVAVTLPCNDNEKYRHTFHEDCIVPWLKQNGTCPVCRFQLVPQPDHHANPNAPGVTFAAIPASGATASSTSTPPLFGGTPPFLGPIHRTSTSNSNSNSNNSNASAPAASSNRSRSASGGGVGSVTDTVRSGVSGLWDMITGSGSHSHSNNQHRPTSPRPMSSRQNTRGGAGGGGGSGNTNSNSRSGQTPPGGWDALD